MKKTCAITGKEFEITDDDLAFYEKIGVPEPTLCPEERQRRRYIWRNERTLYRRDCDLCGKSMVSLYDNSAPFSVYCTSCWWSDKWDASDYGKDIDFHRNFFGQLKELQRSVPRPNLMNKNCTNSEFTNHTVFSKNCYMSYVAWESENILYSSSVVRGKDCVDCYRTEEGTNALLYECINAFRSYNSQFCILIQDCSDCFYCFDCRGCQNCFMSYNQRNKSYMWENEQLSKEVWHERWKKLIIQKYSVREHLYAKWVELVFEKVLHEAVLVEQSISAEGNLIYNCKNAKNSFEINYLEDVANIIVGLEAKDIRDCYHTGTGGTELAYDSHAVTGVYRALFSHLSYDNSHIQYCDTCHNSENLFGCISVKKGSYMILNKQYTKEQYTELKEKLINHMKETGEYGEFFPAENSPFAYNETQAQVYMPLTKKEAQERGYTWQDNLPGTYNKETIQPEELPDDIHDIDDSITKEILVCEQTGRNYNIVHQELQFYRQNNIPIPRLHPDERYKRRNALRPDRKLYDAVCSETGEPIQTAWPPERRPKRLVSEKIYKQEIL